MSCKTYHIYHTFLLPKKHPAIGIDFQKGNLSASQKHEQSDFDLEDSQFKNNTRVHATTSNEVKKRNLNGKMNLQKTYDVDGSISNTFQAPVSHTRQSQS